jgi:hypothetical protein
MMANIAAEAVGVGRRVALQAQGGEGAMRSHAAIRLARAGCVITHPLQLYFGDQFHGFGLNLAIQPKPILI